MGRVWPGISVRPCIVALHSLLGIAVHSTYGLILFSEKQRMDCSKSPQSLQHLAPNSAWTFYLEGPGGPELSVEFL